MARRRSTKRRTTKKRGGKLTAARRRRLKKSSFGLPGSRKYPVHDRKHAANAKARAKQQLKKGKLSRSSYNRIVAKANRKLGKSK